MTERARVERENSGEVDEHEAPLEAWQVPLVCAVCLNVPIGTARQCCNGHIICDSLLPAGVQLDSHPPGCCLTQVRVFAKRAKRPPQCPTCRETLPKKLPRNRVVEQLATQMPCKCPHSYCGENHSRGDMPTHKASCVFEPGALLRACRVGNVVAAKVHLKAGAPVDQREAATGYTALFFAVTTGQEGLTRTLLAGPHQRADPNKLCMGTAGRAPLHFAAMASGVPPMRREAVMRALLRAGADVNMGNRRGRTALFEAAEADDLSSVEVLLSAPGVVAGKAGVDGKTPLFAAASGGFLEILERLVKVDGESVKNGAAADIARRNGHARCAKLLANLGANARREVLEARRAKTRRLDTEYIPDHHHAPVADHIERVVLPVAAAMAHASRLLPPAGFAWERQSPQARANDLHRGVESDSESEGDESDDGLGHLNGEDSGYQSYSDNNLEEGSDEESDSADSD